VTAPAEQQAPARPPRDYAAQAEAQAAEQDFEVNAVTPALAAFVAAVLAFSRGQGHLMGSPLTVARKVGYYGAVAAILTQIASRALEHSRSWAGPRAAEELWGGQDQGLEVGRGAGLAVLARAARVIARKARADEARGGAPGVSLPGEPWSPDALQTPSYADPDILGLPVVQSTRHAAQLAAAEEAGWTRKAWIDMHDNRVRMTHAFLGSPKYEYHTVPIGEPFVTVDGNKLWYPGDTSAPIHEWVRCRCWLKLSR
jgi:hypothetical protein